MDKEIERLERIEEGIRESRLQRLVYLRGLPGKEAQEAADEIEARMADEDRLWEAIEAEAERWAAQVDAIRKLPEHGGEED